MTLFQAIVALLTDHTHFKDQYNVASMTEQNININTVIIKHQMTILIKKKMKLVHLCYHRHQDCRHQQPSQQFHQLYPLQN